MPEFAELVAATADLVPQARAAAFVERFAAKHPDFYSEQVFGSRETLLNGAERLFDPQRAPRLESSRRITLDDVLGTGRRVALVLTGLATALSLAFLLGNSVQISEGGGPSPITSRRMSAPPATAAATARSVWSTPL